MDGIKLGIAEQQASLSKISNNTESAKDTLSIIDGTLNGIGEDVRQIDGYTASIRASSSNTATATSSINSAVGTTADASTSNTVIGLLKSIANKL